MSQHVSLLFKIILQQLSVGTHMKNSIVNCDLR